MSLSELFSKFMCFFVPLVFFGFLAFCFIVEVLALILEVLESRERKKKG